MGNDTIRTQHAYHVQVEYMFKFFASTRGMTKTRFINETLYPYILREIKKDGGLDFVKTQYENQTGRDFLPIGELFPNLAKKDKEEEIDATMLEIEEMAVE